MISRHNIADIHAIQEQAENLNYWDFIDWLVLNNCDIFNAEGKTFDFNYKSVTATVTKESHLNGEFELYDGEDWIGLINTELIRFKADK
jgi:hypothetical protein